MDELPEGVESKFRYVMLISKRAEQLIQGAMPKERVRGRKPTRIAQQEVNKGLVRWQMEPPLEEIEPIIDPLTDSLQ